tara:strand:- start:189 stop:536 length:348 start_codon:yes stop_codon:yes gene_type:complete
MAGRARAIIRLSNSSPEGRAAPRREEVVLTPDEEEAITLELEKEEEEEEGGAGDSPKSDEAALFEKIPTFRQRRAAFPIPSSRAAFFPIAGTNAVANNHVVHSKRIKTAQPCMLL